MANHSHHFVENYKGFVGFGYDRSTNENTIIYYLQKFSDDTLMKTIVKKLSDEDLEQVFDMITGLLKKYLKDSEYHALFLKDEQVRGREET